MPTSLPRSLAALITLVFLAVLVRTAWISDDALITLRTVLNVTHGYGLTFNIAERVQTFTHPLWMLFLTLAYLIVGNAYIATFALAIGVSVTAFWLALTRAVSVWQAAAVAAMLLFSRAFVDYSTSGLENPLSCLLTAVVFGVTLTPVGTRPGAAGRRLLLVVTLTSLLYLARPDNVLVAFPLIVVACWRTRRAAEILKAVTIGALPAVAWTLFALIYYGAPFPNTAYAKLGSGTVRSELVQQGLVYLLDSIDRDPLTLTVIAFALVAGLLRGTPALRALAVGIASYLAYIVWIGGDFMTGRFVAVPLFAAALLLGAWRGGTRTAWIVATALFVVVGSTAEHVSLLSDSRFNDLGIRANGVADERGVFFQNRALVRATRSTMIDPDWPKAGRSSARVTVVKTCGLLGSGGLDFGPYRHWLDECALADPLLARLPAVFNLDWRMAHFRRMIPDGYEESLTMNQNLLKDPDLRRFYDDVRIITRSPRLFTRARWAAILRLNTRKDDALVNRVYYRHEGTVVPIDALSTITEDGTATDAPHTRPITTVLTLSCADQPGRRYFDVALSADAGFRLTFLRHDTAVGVVDLGPIPEYRRKPGLESYTVDLPARATDEGFDMVLVVRRSDDKAGAIGHFIIEGSPRTDVELHRRVAIRDGLAK